jgi:hypothetical protein
MTRRRRPEQDVQKAVAEHLRPRAPGTLTQRAAHDGMRAADAEIAVAVGNHAALAQLEYCGLLRGQAQ